MLKLLENRFLVMAVIWIVISVVCFFSDYLWLGVLGLGIATFDAFTHFRRKR